LVIVLLAATFNARAELLPLKAYTVADGLAHNDVHKIVRDSRGFLWFCTAEGLSRFDGYSFTTYGTDQGLPHRNVTDFLETRGGEFWLGTSGGLVRFNQKGEPANRVINENAGEAASQMFTVIVPEDKDRRAQSVTVVFEGRDRTIWVGTLKGLYRLDRANGKFELRPVDLGMPSENPEQRFVLDLLEDDQGSLWIASASGLYCQRPDGTTAHFTKREGLPGEFVLDLSVDQEGQLWAGTRDHGFFRFVPSEAHGPPVIAEAYIYASESGVIKWINQLFETSDRRFWIASNEGLVEFFRNGDEDGRRFHAYTARNGLLYHEITALNQDTGGNLWLGTYAGAMKLARNGFVTYGERDGLMGVTAIFADGEGGVCFRGYVLGDQHTSVFDGAKWDYLRPADFYHFRYGCFDGHRFEWFLPQLPKNRSFGWVGEGLTLQTREGEWWLGTGEGLYRYPPSSGFTGIKTMRPLAIYQTRENLTQYQQVFRIFEDSRGDIWASTIAVPNGLGRWDRATEHFRRDLADSAVLPSSADDLARSFGEDRAGNVWIGFSTGLARYRGGSFTFFDARNGLPPGEIQYIYSDRQGRLWLASARSGLIRIDHPELDLPVFKSYTTEQGLSSNTTAVITEDLANHIYVATGRGLDRLDPETGRIKHFTTADGLTAGEIGAAFRDRQGTLWFGTSKGLSRFTPGTDTAAQPPPVLITKLQVAGVKEIISSLGETEIVLPDLAADRNQLQIDFVGLSFAPGEVVRYQYRLEGADPDWSVPAEQRTVNFANLASGRYRFLVRALNSDGVASARPATVTFTILRPLWQRWWFVALVMLIVGLIAYSVYRYRLARLLDLERVRTRIATDLHDDIGANLTRIAILSEVAKQQSGNGNAGEDGSLASIARISRESVAAMSDIVWAINPHRDQLIDLVRRMRQHAEELFTTRDIELRFEAPDAENNLKVGVDVRRDLLLIFKEAVNNTARHSGCSRVEINLNVEGSRLTLIVRDDGQGFDTSIEGDGQGLMSIRRRAERLGGTLKIESSPNSGSTITLRIPLVFSLSKTAEGPTSAGR